jgi:deoxyribodipyrimidine photo-lyase
MHEKTLVWFRRDLRSYDHAALSHALRQSGQVHCVFIFDTDILDKLPGEPQDKRDRRVDFIWHSARELNAALEGMGGGLIVRHGSARKLIPELARELGVHAVFANRDYEPEAILRDAAVEEALQADGIEWMSFKDSVIFERDQLLSGSNRPYTVFTPYKNAWLKRIGDADLQLHPVAEHAAALVRPAPDAMPSLQSMGFQHTDLGTLDAKPGMTGAAAAWRAFEEQLAQYDRLRDLPALHATSLLSVHLRFGTCSVREMARRAYYASGRGADTWLSELIWREFFQMILFFHPRVINQAYRTEFDAIRWPGRDEHFEAWCEGRTGYPIVDAGMRELNRTGFMHNRVRMIVASFLVKDLLVDWRRGERYFAQKLLDYDLAANNGNWQWAASTGCDAQPYFRIFNPVSQSQKYDPDGAYIRRWVPELAALSNRDIHAPWNITPIEQQAIGVVLGRDYPLPIVDHALMRSRALELFKSARPSEELA